VSFLCWWWLVTLPAGLGCPLDTPELELLLVETEPFGPPLGCWKNQ